MIFYLDASSVVALLRSAKWLQILWKIGKIAIKSHYLVRFSCFFIVKIVEKRIIL